MLMQRADEHDVDERQPRAQRVARSAGILAEIRLVDEDHRRRAAVPDHREIPLEPPGIQVVRQRRDEKDRLDVRGNDLLFDRPPRRRARHDGTAFQHMVNDSVANTDPIADGRKGRSGRGLVSKLAADFREPLCVTGDVIQRTLLLYNASKLQIAAVECRGMCFEKRIPPQTLS